MLNASVTTLAHFKNFNCLTKSAVAIFSIIVENITGVYDILKRQFKFLKKIQNLTNESNLSLYPAL